MSDDEQLTSEFVADFKALHDDRECLTLKLSKFQAWCLMAAVQLASKHPEGGRTVPLRVSTMIARDLQEQIATTPTLARVAEQGWTG
jgi:hypothetical protein